MTYNFNRPSGILTIYFLGAATASFPPSFLFRANNDDITGNIFTIIGASLLIIAALFMLGNKSASKKKDLSKESRATFIHAILLLAIITAVVMFILGETVRFYEE